MHKRTDPSTNLPAREKPDVFDIYLNPQRQKAAQEGRPFEVDFELTLKCAASCRFCHTSSVGNSNAAMPKEKVFSVLEELRDLNIRQVWWQGGDPLLHPDLFEILEFSSAVGLKNSIGTSGLPVTRSMAKRLYQQWEKRNINMVVIHIDTIHQETYNRLHQIPGGLAKKLRGYRNLLEAGFTSERVLPCLTMTKPAIERIEETLDWYIDDMGVNFVEMTVFKPKGGGKNDKELEPSKWDLKRAFEYRAKKLGNPKWLKMATTECSSIRCQTNFYVGSDGSIKRCPCLPDDFIVGNLYQETLRQIFQEHRSQISFNDLEIKGKCAVCDNNPLCRGCRASAFFYADDLSASDPKCWLNPEAPEYCLR